MSYNVQLLDILSKKTNQAKEHLILLDNHREHYLVVILSIFGL